MRILFVTSHFPYPLNDGSKIRDYLLIRELSSLCAVFLVSFIESEQENDYRYHLESCCAGIETILRKRPRQVPAAIRYASNLLSDWPFTVQDFWDKGFAARLRELCEQWQIDVVQLQKLQMVSYRNHLPFSVPCVLDHHNVDSILWHRYSESVRNPLAKLFLQMQFKKAYRLERNLCKLFDCVLAVSEHDRQVLAEMSGSCIETAPIGVDLAYFSPLEYSISDRRADDAFTLVFTGSMSWYPNRHAAISFAREVFPRVRRALPSARFYIVGRDPTADVQRLESEILGVFVTGSVPDVRPYLAKADVVVAPINVGSGTKVKVLEAMAMGKPVVASPEAAEGVSARHGVEICVAGSADQFVSAILDLSEPQRREAMGMAARRFVEVHHNPRIVAEQLYERYEMLVAKTGRA
jgi:sugar transferase (PEP-CTERM/EpsH1 system associated)